MDKRPFTVHVPATTANLGPGSMRDRTGRRAHAPTGREGGRLEHGPADDTPDRGVGASRTLGWHDA